jgi:hypothetical protein
MKETKREQNIINKKQKIRKHAICYTHKKEMRPEDLKGSA